LFYKMNRFNLIYAHINIDQFTCIEHFKYGKTKLRVLVVWTFN